ncbi:unnamed protein product, partial [Polarella glacialis]
VPKAVLMLNDGRVYFRWRDCGSQGPGELSSEQKGKAVMFQLYWDEKGMGAVQVCDAISLQPLAQQYGGHQQQDNYSKLLAVQDLPTGSRQVVELGKEMDRCLLHLVVMRAQAGCIIGQKGDTVKDLKARSGVDRINVENGMSDYRLVEVKGSPSAVAEATLLIAELLSKDSEGAPTGPMEVRMAMPDDGFGRVVGKGKVHLTAVQDKCKGCTVQIASKVPVSQGLVQAVAVSGTPEGMAEVYFCMPVCLVGSLRLPEGVLPKRGPPRRDEFEASEKQARKDEVLRMFEDIFLSHVAKAKERKEQELQEAAESALAAVEKGKGAHTAAVRNVRADGRIVFLGNNVRDEDGQVALFGDLSSGPVTMEASRMCDAFGLLSGHAIEQADAEQAYIQSPLGGTETYIRLPKELQPDSWKHMRDPVCKLVMSLYGHPDAGGFWQAHCKNALESVGFIEVSESWQSLFYHPELTVMMAVYVDDFKASGPVEALKKAWTLVRSKIRTGAPTPIGRYLGCHHNVVELKDRRVIEYDMRDFLEQCVSRYKKVCGEDVVLKKASTPFLDEDKLPEEDDNEPGLPNGLFLVMRLFRLMCYINDSKGLKMRVYVGRDDKAEDLFLRLFAVADFAGCRETARSTSGVFLGIYGKNTFVPVAAQAKKQSCVSHSTPEAELVAANLALRFQGLPALEVFDKVFGRKVKLFFEEDNDTAISTIKAGYSNTMRHLGRTHRVSLRWMHEVFQDGQCEIRRCDTLLQAADISTKGFTSLDKWVAALTMIGIG